MNDAPQRPLAGRFVADARYAPQRSAGPGVDVDADGAELLTSARVGELLAAAVEHAGGRLVSWALDHIDAQPHHSTTATFTSVVDWPYGRRDELLGVSARAGGLVDTDERAEIFADGEREVAVWIYPHDPDLPGLSRAAYPDKMAAILTTHGVVDREVSAAQVRLHMIGYRPRRRAVVKVTLTDTHENFYVKVLRKRAFHDVLRRHELLLGAGVPSPQVATTTSDFLLVLRELSGRPLSQAMFDAQNPCTAEDLIGVLDAMPSAVAQLERRPPWSDAVRHYATMVAQAAPHLEAKLDWMANLIDEGLATVELGHEATHGDFHEGQIHVAHGRITGILDVDTIGPGRRVDDLACLVAHLSTVQRMSAEQQERVHHLIRTWVPVFDTRVDPTELRLRAAAVIISLATGPFRSQEPDWERETHQIVLAAEALVRQVR